MSAGAAVDAAGADSTRAGTAGGPIGPGSAPGRPGPSRPRGADGVRGHRQSPLLALRGELSPTTRLALGLTGIVTVLGAWALASTVWASTGISVPTMAETLRALQEMWRSGELWTDLAASTRRVFIGYGASFVIGAVVGLAVGSFRSVESFVEPQVGLLRYIPASALTPLLLIWLGIDEAPKLALILIGTVFYNVLMVADVARAVPLPLINTAYTLGAGRWTVLRRVVLPHSWPGMIDVARINLAAAWLMLVVAELLAAQEGLAFRIVRAQRFQRIDRMFALLLVFALIGVASDVSLRWLRNRTSPWAKP